MFHKYLAYLEFTLNRIQCIFCLTISNISIAQKILFSMKGTFSRISKEILQIKGIEYIVKRDPFKIRNRPFKIQN